jgi:hypothetical protein
METSKRMKFLSFQKIEFICLSTKLNRQDRVTVIKQNLF